MKLENFDKYMDAQFRKYCPDSARFLESLNPIACKHAEEDRFFFTVGMLIRNSFDEDEIINWDSAIAADVCPKCENYDPVEVCEEDPANCEAFRKLEDQLLASLKNQERRTE